MPAPKSPAYLEGHARSPTAARIALRVATVGAALLAALSAGSAEALRLVATTPDLGSLSREVVGVRAVVETIIPPGADPETFQPRPSDLAKLKGAAVIVRVGLGHDHWLDKLLVQHGDPRINRRGPGYVDASVGIPLLEVKGRTIDVTAPDGHVHGLANPHYWLDPANAEVITAGIAEAVIRVAPELTQHVIAQRDSFLERLKARLAVWGERLAPHKSSRVVTFHNTWPYFARRFRLDIVDVVQPKEGVSPSPARLAKLVATIRDKNVRVILHEPYEPDEASQLLARRTGATVLKLSPSVGSLPDTPDYISLFDYNVDRLVQALSPLSR